MHERIVALYEQRMPTKQIAEFIGTCRSGTRRIRQRLRAKQCRQQWHESLKHVPPQKLMFIDESGARTDMTRLYGWGPVGQRVNCPVPAGHWKTCTMLSAVRLSGPLAAVTLDAAVNAESFVFWVREVLAPHLLSGDVVVMDNLPAHKVPGVAEAVIQAGAVLRYCRRIHRT